MKKISTKSLIDSLCQDLKEEKPLPRVWQVVTIYLIFVFVLSLGVTLSIQPFRPTWWVDLQSPRFFIENLTLAFCVLVFAWMGVGLSIPGVSPLSVQLRWVGWVPLMFFVVLQLYGEPSIYHGEVGVRGGCYLEVFFVSGLGVILSLLWLKRSLCGPFTKISLFYLSMATGGSSFLMMQLACMYHPSHNFFAHGLPLCLAVILGMVVNRLGGNDSV